MFNKNRKTPEMPKDPRKRNEMMWEAIFNHIPHRLAWQDMKLNFVLVLLALILAAQAADLF